MIPELNCSRFPLICCWDHRRVSILKGGSLIITCTLLGCNSLHPIDARVLVIGSVFSLVYNSAVWGCVYRRRGERGSPAQMHIYTLSTFSSSLCREPRVPHNTPAYDGMEWNTQRFFSNISASLLESPHFWNGVRYLFLS